MSDTIKNLITDSRTFSSTDAEGFEVETPQELSDSNSFISSELPLSIESAAIQHSEALTTSDAEINGDDSEKSRLRKWATRGALGAVALGAAWTLYSNPIGELKDEVVEKAPIALLGLGFSEAMWVGGSVMMAGSAGQNFRKTDFFHPHKAFNNQYASYTEASNKMLSSETFKLGLTMNTAGAIGSAATIAAGAVAALPREMWPGAVGLAALDVAATVGVRAPIRHAMREADKTATSEKESKHVTVRPVRLSDIDALADLDLSLFSKAYGEELPSKDQVLEMLYARRRNATWMYVAEVNGKVGGFVSAFRTNKPAEEFESWEKSTNNGTLEGKVEPDGKYVYVANMTLGHDVVVEGGKDMILARLFSQAIKAGGIEYGYFESRMPNFRRWLTKTGKMTNDPEVLDELAQEYAQTTISATNEKLIDPQLRMYASDGFEQGRPVANAFEDYASMNYGVVFKAPIPMQGKVSSFKPLKWTAGRTLEHVSHYPKLLNKVLKYV
jgi:hypothetical protein